jgi:hypothetical protein
VLVFHYNGWLNSEQSLGIAGIESALLKRTRSKNSIFRNYVLNEIFQYDRIHAKGEKFRLIKLRVQKNFLPATGISSLVEKFFKETLIS